jgi:hypothetical protein
MITKYRRRSEIRVIKGGKGHEGSKIRCLFVSIFKYPARVCVS